jgi:hypothetical protein
VLFYVYAEPVQWPDGRAIAEPDLKTHGVEIAQFAAAVKGDEVRFVSASYGELLTTWLEAQDESVRAHAVALIARFSP